MKRQDQKKVIIRLLEDVHKEFKLKVIKNNTSIQDILEKAVKEYLKKNK